MEHATIIGVVVPAHVHPSLQGVRFLVAVPEDEHGKPTGPPFVLADPLQAGPGQRVHWVRGREAALAFDDARGPLDAAVVGLVDGFDADEGGQ